MAHAHIAAAALALLLAIAPLAAAAKDDTDHPAAPGKEKRQEAPTAPAPTSPPPASAPTTATIPAPPPPPAPSSSAPALAPAPAPPPAPAPIPAAAPPRVSPAVLERRLAAFDVGGPMDAPGAPIVLAATLLPAAPSSAWPWEAPLLALFGLGTVIATVRLLRRPPLLEPAAPRLVLARADDVRALLLAGKGAVERGAIAEAVAWFTQALARDPSLAVAHYSKGVCLASLGRHEDAYAALRRAFEIDPAEGAFRLDLARAAARTGRGAEAMGVLEPLLAALPALAPDAAEDEAFAGLRDHPRFLAMTGRI